MIVEYSRMCTRGTLTQFLVRTSSEFLDLIISQVQNSAARHYPGAWNPRELGGCSPVSGFPFIWEEGDKAMSQLHE